MSCLAWPLSFWMLPERYAVNNRDCSRGEGIHTRCHLPTISRNGVLLSTKTVERALGVSLRLSGVDLGLSGGVFLLASSVHDLAPATSPTVSTIVPLRECTAQKLFCNKREKLMFYGVNGDVYRTSPGVAGEPNLASICPPPI